MKRISIFVVLLHLFSSSLVGQITIMESQLEEPKYDNYVYDSLNNVVTKKYNGKYTFHHLIGQTLMFCGNSTGNKYWEGWSKESFKIGDYYRVDDVLPDDVGKGLYGRLVLTNLKDGTQSTDGSLQTNEYNYRWVSLGHYEKLKYLYLGKELVYVDNYTPNVLRSLSSDTITSPKPGTPWTCIDIQVKMRKSTDDMRTSDQRSPLVMVIDNPIYGKHYCYFENELGEPFKHYIIRGTKSLICGMFQTKEDNEKEKIANQKRKAELTRKYGAKNAKDIMDGVIRTGMTKDMCRESWGNPDKINRTITSYGTSEQWVYGTNYVYFDGNRLSAIQD